MCTPRRMRPTKRSETTSCRAAARWRASSASCSGGSERASSRLRSAYSCQVIAGSSSGERPAASSASRASRRSVRSRRACKRRAATAPPCARTRAPSPPAARRPSARTGGRRHREGSMSAAATFSTLRKVARGAATAWKARRRAHDAPARHPCSHGREAGLRPVLSTPVTTPGLAISPSSAPRWVTRSASATTKPPRRSRASSAVAARSWLGPAETWSVAVDARLLDRAPDARPPTPAA